MSSRRQRLLIVLTVGVAVFAITALRTFTRPNRMPPLFDEHWKWAILIALLAMFYAAFGRD